MDEVCARINCVPSFQEFAWDGTIIATGEGQFDMAGGGITITEARDEVVDFSISFISTEQKMLVAKGDSEIGSRADLEASDCTVGSQTGTTNYDLSVDVVGEGRIAAFESFAFAVQALITGDVCAVIMDDVAGQGYQGENADSVDMLAESLQSDPLGWAFTEGSDLVAPFNAALQSMKDDGSLAALNGKYFGTAFIITYDDIGDGAYAEEAAPAVEPLGGDLAMCRANWASGYVQAEIVRQVLQSAGYGVSDPSLLELAPSTAYTTMARGDCDFWANSWYPNHYSWYENELPDGSLVSDHVEAVDGLFQDSGVQGWLITKSWADAEGIVSMDQINRTPALYEALDTDGDGKGEILGCPEDWTCDDTQEQIIAFAGWDNLVQTKAGYDALFAEFVNRVRAGDPGVMYTWTPSSYVVEMVPGVDVYWLSIEEDSVLDDSNPLGMSGGESQSQGDGFRDAPADTCTQPCQLGWEAADIQVSARSDVLAGDPYLHNLLVQIRPSILDISILQVEQTNGDGSEAHVQQLAAGWMELNADIVAGWREAAKAG
jgi:ABC-type proline/glycine betaine transport system substrate-binding protein